MENFHPAEELDGTWPEKKFKLDPQRILFSILWLHNAEPPDLQTVVKLKPT